MIDGNRNSFPSGLRFLRELRPEAAGNSGILAHAASRIRAVQYVSQLAQHPVDGEDTYTSKATQ